MLSEALVFCLLDAEGDYTPDGYTLLDKVSAGDYELKLWQGIAHVNSVPRKFSEISLAAHGRSFDPESQKQKYTGSVSALGHRHELLAVIERWLKRYGELFVGSYNSHKLALYHKLFQRYLRGLYVSSPYAPFDECEGQPEYFKVSANTPAARESSEDLKRRLLDLPSAEEKVFTDIKATLDALIKNRELTDDNKNEVIDDVVSEAMDKSGFITEYSQEEARQIARMITRAQVYAYQQLDNAKRTPT